MDPNQYPTFGGKWNYNDIESDSDEPMGDVPQWSPPPQERVNVDDVNDEAFSEDDEAKEDN